MCPDKKNRVASLLEGVYITCPGVAKYILCPGLQPFGEKALEIIRASCAMTIYYNHIACPGSACPSHCCIHLIRIEFSTLFIERGAACHLLPGFYTGYPLHITKNHNTHDYLAFA